MKVKNIYQMLTLGLSSIIIIGCAGNKEPVKKPVVSNKPTTPVVQSSGASVKDLKSAGFGTIRIKGKKEYSQNQAIRFNVDTKGKTGYLYIIYLDEKGNTALLYPNAKSPLTELNGKYVFPKDFGGMAITATKDCKSCEQERTTVYAVLSKEPISDIKSLKAKHLMQGKEPSNQSKAIKMSLAGESNQNSNINIGKIEFFVK